jgi:hypothetical protein
VLALSLTGVAHSEQLKALPVTTYVLADPDGKPKYVVQYSQESNFRTVYHVKPAQPDDASEAQPPKPKRRPAPRKRFIWPTEVM